MDCAFCGKPTMYENHADCTELYESQWEERLAEAFTPVVDADPWGAMLLGEEVPDEQES